VLLVIWDGMRPDFIREDLTPNAWSLVQRGTFFAKNHATYISTTEVNGSGIATGMKPQHHGIFANNEYRPEVNLIATVATQGAWPIRVGDILSSKQWLTAPTIAEQVRKAGFTTAVAGTKEVALLHDRGFDRTGAAPHVFQGKTHPKSHLEVLEKALGKWPSVPKENEDFNAGKKMPDGFVPKSNTAQNRWTTRALIEELWKEGVPKYSTLWLGDPDYSQHFTRPGSPTALSAIRDSDTHLGLAIAELRKRGVLEKTNIFLVSDHGFSTIERAVPYGKSLTAFGRGAAKKKFNAITRFKQTPRPGDVLFTTGGSNLLYVVDHDPEIIAEIVEWLQSGDFAGPIFTRDGLPGTFKFADAWIDTAHSPDILWSSSWSERPNNFGVPGGLTSDGTKPGAGSHGSTSRFCIHNTLLAAGPDIRPGFRDELPSGNVDVAPTILHLLGIKPEKPFDGRILAEALAGTNGTPPTPTTRRIEVKRDLPNGGQWSQWLQITTLGDKEYLDEGNSSAGDTK
jgi:arylsulfatase A-like enzyme